MLFQVELELSLGVQIKATLYLAKNRYRTYLRARIWDPNPDQGSITKNHFPLIEDSKF